MSALGKPVLINLNSAYWLSSIGNDVVHSTIVVDTIDANVANVSTLIAEQIQASTVNVSSLNFENSDVSGMYVSSIRGNSAFFSTLNIASDLSGGLGYVRFHVDASGVQVDGDPIRFDNLVYLTSTINIIQVSTLVDTDIFASNGYFSSLSSGSLSTGLLQGRQAFLSSLVCNDISGNNASFDSLFVSTLEALDISGVAASNWSLYPTLNSSITFQPGFVLSNVGPTLYFAGVELTDVSGGGQDWSRFPAVSTVQMSNNLMTGVSTVVFQDGGRLTSLTGNNLQYNGQPIAFGSASNVSQWANFPAVANVNMNQRSLSNALGITTSNAVILGDNITSGYTFTNSLGVGGLSLVPVASLSAGGDLSVRNIEVGDAITGVADVNIYGGGPTVLPGDSALYVQGGVQIDGGAIHGFAAGVLPVAGINTGRMELLTAGFNILHPAVGAITTGAAMSLTAGGAISIAAGGYAELNTSTLQMINTSQGNKNTTIQAGFLTVDPDVAPTSSIKLFNTLGGGVEIDGGGQGSLRGFSTVAAANISSFSTVGTTAVFNYIQNSTIFYGMGLGVSSVIGSGNFNNIKVADDITGITNAPMPLQSRIVNFSSIQSGTMSTINLAVSTINGLPWDVSGGNASVSSFQTLQTSTLKVSSIAGTQGTTLAGSTIFVEGGLQFYGGAQAFAGAGSRFLSSLREINSLGDNLNINASTINMLVPGGANPNAYIRIGGGSAFDSFFVGQGLSTQRIIAKSTNTDLLTVSTIGVAPGGGGTIKVDGPLSFTNPYILQNVLGLNTGPLPFEMELSASSISMTAPTRVSTLYGLPDVHVFSSLISPKFSTLNIQLSSINGVNFYDISGINVPNDKFSTATISSLTVSSINNLSPTVSGTVPVGGIIMWSGAGVPANWALCNGTNGTPNLSGQFILAEGGSFTRGQSGGSFTIGLAQIPSHTHTITDPGHAHDVVLTGLYNNGENGNNTTYAGQALGGPETRALDPGAARSTFTGINITNTAGQGQPYYQPYYVLAYIMRIS